MKYEEKEIILPIVRGFINEDLQGRYKEHASDKMLEALIMQRMQESWKDHDPFISRGHSLLRGDINVAYDAVCVIFESILEHGCRAGGNGHHVAQRFSAYCKHALSASLEDQAEATAEVIREEALDDVKLDEAREEREAETGGFEDHS